MVRISKPWNIGLILFLFLVATTVILAWPVFVSAHPGGTDSSGCHTCRTNCPDWGLSYGEYHCHNAKSYSQPLDPIRSHYGSDGTGYTEPWPEYNYGYSPPSYPSTPSCPLFSTYDSLSSSCKCNYGYVVDGGSCTSGNTVCHRKHGYSSSYSGLSNSCECDYGNILNSSSQCVSKDDLCQESFGYNAEYKILGDACGCRSGYVFNDSQTSCMSGNSYCQGKYGFNSNYDGLGKSCECDSGYVFNSSGTQCISKDTSCQNLLGFNSRFNSLNESCECDSGYTLSNGQCIEKPAPIRSFVTPPVSIISLPPPKVEPVVNFQPKSALKSPVITSVSEVKKTSKTESVDKKKEPLKDSDFYLIGNEHLRKCDSLDCPVVKYGSVDGQATILEQKSAWYKVVVTDDSGAKEGWFNEILVPDETKKRFASLVQSLPQSTGEGSINKELQNKSKRPFSRLLNWVRGLFK